jgi:CspA family cold shock protein
MSDINDGGSGNNGDALIVEGVVKWFDTDKGYGFLVSDNGSKDVLVHHSALTRAGHTVLYPGAKVKFTVVERVQGLQADRVISVDNSEAELTSSSIRPTSAIDQVKNVGEFERAIVKWFNRIRGFGFVNTEDGGDDIFVHMETLRHVNIEILVPGQYAMVKSGTGPKGLMAVDVRRIDAGELSKNAGLCDSGKADAKSKISPASGGLFQDNTAMSSEKLNVAEDGATISAVSEKENVPNT